MKIKIAVKVFTTVFFFFVVSVFVSPINVQAAASDIVFTEIMYDLAGADAGHEWVEIYNSGSEAVTMVEGSGTDSWRFNEGSNHTLTLVQGSLVVPAGGVAVLAGNGAVFLIDHPGFSGTLIDTVMSLNNTSETLKLSADKGATFFGEVTYQNTWGGNGDGKSLEKINLNGGNDSNNWRAAAADGGTPGVVTTSSPTAVTTTPTGSGPSGSGSAINPIPLKAEAGADVVAEINQVIKLNASASQGATAYKWYLGDGALKEGTEIEYRYKFPGTYLVTLEVTNGNEVNWDQLKASIFGGRAVINEFFASSASPTGQWLEIFNPTAGSLDLSGWILEAAGKKFTVPPFVVIPAHGYLVLSDEITGLYLDQPSRISLKYPNDLAVDEVDLEKMEPNASASRTGNGFFWSREPTPGRPNIILSSETSLSSAVTAAPNKIAWRSNIEPTNLVVSTYDEVMAIPIEIPPEPETSGNEATSGILNFLKVGLGKTWLWVLGVIILSALVSFIYVKTIKKTG